MRTNLERPSTLPAAVRTHRRWTSALALVVVSMTVVSFALVTATAGATPLRGAGPTPALAVAAPVRASPNALSPPPAAPSVAPSGELGSFHLSGPHPSSWGAAGVPPGWEAMQPSHLAQSSSHTEATSPSSSSSSNWLNRFCAGLWPGGPADWAQYYYEGNCYGHDEPGVQFYSDLPGSGGNVTWNVTLPVDRSPTLNQSNLYAAIWFGMTLSDPLGWLGQCFLELQFYPDQTWYNPGPMFPNATVNGDWVAAAVAWQIESATGFEDPCFYEPAYLHGTPGPAFLNMTQGDHITITMTGWQDNPTGEQIAIFDHHNGQSSKFTLFDSAGGFPLNPAYSATDYPNSMQWTPGGEFPVSFALETGHAGNPDWPANNSYGGCSGGPKATAADPGAPCPSYDPGSWANDTLTPWVIHTPTFFNAHARYTPSQVAFSQPEGGIALVDQTSNGVCSGSEGSAWCTYPWYSYYCDNHAFEFGGLDYPGVAADFGKYSQFTSNAISDAAGIGFFEPTNFSIPTCGAPSYTVSVGTAGGPGSLDLLSHNYASAATISGLGAGEYSLSALPGSGESFGSWVTTGGVAVNFPHSPWATLVVTGSGTLVASFTHSPVLTTIKFDDLPGGRIGVNPTPFFSDDGTGLATVNYGGSLSLAGGLYPIEAYPKVGYVFSHWTVSGGGLSVAAPQFPFTWLLVSGSGGNGKLVAHYTASSLTATVYLVVEGATGSAKLGGLSVTNPTQNGLSYSVATFHVGSYALTLAPGPHTYSSIIEYFFPVIAMMNFSSHTRVTLENGTSEILIDYVPAATVRIVAAPSAGGGIEAVGPSGFSAVPSGSTSRVAAGTYEWIAKPSAHYTFTGWSTSNSADATFLTSPASPLLAATVEGPSSITAHFAYVTSLDKVTFSATSGTGARMSFNFGPPVASGSSFKVAPGQYFVQAGAAVGWTMSGWTSSGAVSILASGPGVAIVLVSASGGIGASFSRTTFLVSFTVYDVSGSGASTAIGHVSASPALRTGETDLLTYGWHSITVTGTSGALKWRASANLLGSGGTTGTTFSFFVSGAGTVYLQVV